MLTMDNKRIKSRFRDFPMVYLVMIFFVAGGVVLNGLLSIYCWFKGLDKNKILYKS